MNYNNYCFLSTGIISINSYFENAFAQKGDSGIPPLIEPDKNIIIMTIDKNRSNSPKSYFSSSSFIIIIIFYKHSFDKKNDFPQFTIITLGLLIMYL